MPSAPTNLTVQIASCTSRVLAWTAPTDGVGADVFPDDTYPGESVDPYLVPTIAGQTYSYEGGANEIDVVINGVTQDGGGDYVFVADGEPLQISYEPLGEVTATLKRAGAIAAYRIYRDDALLIEVGPNVTSYTDTVSAAPHKYAVSAVDSAGGESDVVTWNGAQWQRHLAGTGQQSVTAVAVDADDNIIVAGVFSGTMNLGTGDITASGSNLFLAKYDSSGTCLWVVKCVSTTINILSIATDASGNIFIGGSAVSVDFGGGTLTAQAFDDAVVAKFNSSGVHQWSKMYGLGSPPLSSGGGSAHGDVCSKLAVDSSGDLIIAGSYSGLITLDNGDTHLGHASIGGRRTFLAKLNTSGTTLWSKTFQYISDLKPVGMVLDSDDNIFLLVQGLNSSPTDLGGGTLPSGGPCFGKLDNDGNHIWSTTLAVTYHPFGQTGLNLAIGPDGDPVVLGQYSSIGGEAGGVTLTRYGIYYNYFTAKYSGVDGTFEWVITFGSVGLATPLGIHCDAQNSVIIVGEYGEVEFLLNHQEIIAAGDSPNGFILKLNDAGVAQWSEAMIGQGGGYFGRGIQEKVGAVSSDSDNFIVAVGTFASERLPVGWQTFTNTNASQHTGTVDSFLYKRPPCP